MRDTRSLVYPIALAALFAACDDSLPPSGDAGATDATDGSTADGPARDANPNALQILDPAPNSELREQIAVKIRCSRLAGQAQSVQVRVDANVTVGDCKADGHAEVPVLLAGSEGPKIIEVSPANQADAPVTTIQVHKRYCAALGHWAHPNFAAGNGSESNPFKICNLEQLQAAADRLTAHFELYGDINAEDTARWEEVDGVVGFQSIGGRASDDASAPHSLFQGTFDGHGHTISDLSVNVADAGLLDPPALGRNTYRAGLFGLIGTQGIVRNLRLRNVRITTDTEGICTRIRTFAGGIAAGNMGRIERCSVVGSVQAHTAAGGLVGLSLGQITDSLSSAEVASTCVAGGLVGQFSSRGIIATSYATGTMKAEVFAGGGIVGQMSGVNEENADLKIRDCFSVLQGTTAGTTLGGIVGRMHRGTLNNCHTSATACIGGATTDYEGTCTPNVPPATFRDPDSPPVSGWDREVWSFPPNDFPQLIPGP